jgi:acyl-CoA dehydrogenase
MKERATERLRVCVNDAMDVHGGKAIMEGPRNYMGALYRAVPVGITVEGANIVTRNLIEFGQGAIRSHPYLLQEIDALSDSDNARGLAAFDRVFWRHVAHSIATFFRAAARAWTSGAFAPAPAAGKATRFYRRMGRYAAAFALTADFALLTLGGALKRKEMLSARFGDVLSELYLLSAALKRWEDEGRQDSDLPLLGYCMEQGFATIAARLDAILANLPNRFVAAILRIAILPFGPDTRGPSDALKVACANVLHEPSPARDRLTAGIFHGRGDDKIGSLDRAFKLTAAAAPLFEKMRKAHLHDIDAAQTAGAIDEDDARALRAVDDAAAVVIAVDDFAADELSLRHGAE